MTFKLEKSDFAPFRGLFSVAGKLVNEKDEILNGLLESDMRFNDIYYYGGRIIRAGMLSSIIPLYNAAIVTLTSAAYATLAHAAYEIFEKWK